MFGAIEPKAGVHLTKVTPTRASPEFADFIESFANRYPEAQTVHLVMDNLSSHKRKALVDRFGGARKRISPTLPMPSQRTLPGNMC